jgi:uroporphyrinogen-III decarboxylase
MASLSSRERMLRTINFMETDYIPCCFMSFAALRKRLDDNWFKVAESELSKGLDSMLFIPMAPRSQRKDHPDLRGLPVRFHPQVATKEWREEKLSGMGVLYKEYFTPAGKLSTSVNLSEDWPHGEHIPFIDDYQIPRVIKPLITCPEDLESLSFLLMPPQKEEIIHFISEADSAYSFTSQHGIILSGGWGVAMDMANWLCGMENLMVLTVEQPDFVTDLIEMIHQWNLKRMEAVLATPMDIYFRRAWYEGRDFVTPKFFKNVILPRLAKEVDLAHEHGVKFGYICTSGTKPMLDYYLQAKIDVLVGIDPIQDPHADLSDLRSKFGGKISLWGGVSAAVTVEMGSETEVRQAVGHAVQQLGPDGFILSPVDNITVDDPHTWQNLECFIDEWKKLRA